MTTSKIKLLSIELTNFKGAESFKLEANANNVDIFGKNGAGKTTIFDAFTWCLFHKDSREKTDFDFEPQGMNTDELDSTSVSLVLDVDGQTRKFTKELNKKKNVKNNVIVKEPNYYVDDLKLKTKKAYDEKVAELIDKDKFKYLTNGSYFMDSLKPAERRQILFKYFGSKTDEEIINENEDLKPLLKYLAESTLADANLRLQQRKQSLEKSIKEIPQQIKGIRKALPEIDDIDFELLNAEKSELIIKIDKEEKDLLALENGSAVTDKKNLIKEKETLLRIAESEYISNQKKKTADLEDERSELRIKYREAEHILNSAIEEIAGIEQEIRNNEKSIEQQKKELAELGKCLDEIEARKFEYPEFVPETFDAHQLVCPTCQRAWELEDQEEMKRNLELEQKKKAEEYQVNKEAAFREFNSKNDADFDRVNKLGKETSESIKKITEETANLKALLESKRDISSLEKEVESIKKQGDEIKSQIESIEKNLVPFEESKECLSIKEEIAGIEKELSELNESISEKVVDKQNIITELKNSVRTIDEKLSVLKEYDRQQAIIDQLILDEKNMSAEKGEIEAELLLFENFFIKKVGLLEENINKHFKFIEFKLFDYYDNGNLDESICEPVLNNVKYRDMSNGEQIKARIDICDTLMRAEGIYVPLFLDNAEGLTEAFETDTQVIALNASKADKKLRINIQDTNKEEVA